MDQNPKLKCLPGWEGGAEQKFKGLLQGLNSFSLPPTLVYPYLSLSDPRK